MRHYFRAAIKSPKRIRVLYGKKKKKKSPASQNNDQEPTNMFPNIKIKIQFILHLK